MSASPDFLIDGDWTRPNTVGPVRLQYPFLGNKDRVSAFFEQEYWQEMARWTPGDLSTPHSPALADFYLVAETEPVNFSAILYSFKRTYSRVPTPQVTYSTIPINKPSGTAGLTFKTTPGGASLGAGTSYGGYALGNGKVYGPYAVTTSATNGSNTRVTWTSHGLAGTEQIIFGENGAYWVCDDADYTVIDTNTIDVLGITRGTALTLGLKYLRNYTPGAGKVRTRNTTTFYLPGITVATAADIPLPGGALNESELLDLMLANLTGYQPYDANPLAIYMGQIYQQTVIEIDMASL